MASTRTSKTAGETSSTDEISSDAVGGSGESVIAVNGVEPDTSDPSSASPETTADGVPKMSEMTGIRYVGRADVRRLSESDLVALGVESPKGDLEWSDQNGKVVPTEQFNAETRDALLALEDFVVA